LSFILAIIALIILINACENKSANFGTNKNNIRKGSIFIARCVRTARGLAAEAYKITPKGNKSIRD
jgi:hypothetical protein